MSAHTRQRMHRYLLSTIAVFAVMGTTLASAAQDEVRVRKQSGISATQKTGSESTSVSVGYADLDLREAAGAKTLYIRLKAAARKVCNPAAGRDLRDRRDWNDCYANAIEGAVAATGSPAVAAVHGEQTGKGRGVRIASND